MERLIVVPDEKDAPLLLDLQARIARIAAQVTAENLCSVIGEVGLRLAVNKAPDSETILWGRAEGKFPAAWTSLAPESAVVGTGMCQASSGLVAEVFSTETARAHAEPLLQAAEWTNLGDLRSRDIVSMRGVPVSVFGRCVGVLTRVFYEDAASAGEDDIARQAAIFGRFSELRILKMCIGMGVNE
jgi:hypothetical protein